MVPAAARKRCLRGARWWRAIGFAAREPIAFQKIASITDTRLPPFEPTTAIDIAPIVRAIPDRGIEGTKDTVFEVHPAHRYQRAVVEGFGNCSNLVKGLSWALVRDGYEFEIVHLLPIHAFLSGQGHTVLRAKLALPEGERTGIVDVAAAAIPRSGGRMLDVADLVGGRPDAHLDPLRYESEPWQQYYKSAFLEDAWSAGSPAPNRPAGIACSMRSTWTWACPTKSTRSSTSASGSRSACTP